MNIQSVELAQGTVRYRDSGEGPVVVFVHGLLVSGTLWNEVTARLSKDFRCLAPDWPLGSHPVPMNADADLSPAGVAKIVADFLEALDLRDVTLVGNDSGGAICQLVMTAHPERLARVVLTTCDAFEVFPPKAFAYLSLVPKVPGLAMVLPKVLRAFPALTRLSMAYGLLTKRPIDAAMIDDWLVPSATSREIRRDLAKFIGGVSPSVTMQVSKELPNVKLPVLIAWSPEDPSFPVSLGQRLKAVIPRATFETIEDSFVFSALDQPHKVASAVARFATGAA